MCQSASFIVTPNSVLWHPKSDSHSDILKKYEIKDDYNTPDFVKVEIIPPDRNYRLPIEKWIYYVDQYYIPKWYNSEEAEKACREELKHWYAEKVIKSGKHTFSGRLNRIIFGGNVTINDLEEFSEIWVYGKSKVEINNMKNGTVSFYDKSEGILNNQSEGHGCVTFFDNSCGTVTNMSSGGVWFRDNTYGTVNNQTGGIVRFYEDSKQLNKQLNK